MAPGHAPPGSVGPPRAAERPPWARQLPCVGSRTPVTGEQRGDWAPQKHL